MTSSCNKKSSRLALRRSISKINQNCHAIEGKLYWCRFWHHFFVAYLFIRHESQVFSDVMWLINVMQGKTKHCQPCLWFLCYSKRWKGGSSLKRLSFKQSDFLVSFSKRIVPNSVFFRFYENMNLGIQILGNKLLFKWSQNTITDL